ncbi:phosphoribosylglycinamide formyltransferase [Candidatus Micrarchaeota archaeon]|nr:phosphoribosylglycinamide formyltransferase [Candidatus Micrarchaeota archaeon]
MGIRIAVLASGRGSNFQSIIDGIKEGDIDGEVVVLISDKPDAYAIERARQNGIPTRVIPPKECASREEMNLKIREALGSYSPDLIVLAGYMRIITDELLIPYLHRIINIHPALLPSFPGLDGQKQAFEYGVKVSGCTVHFVDGGCDTGPIIEQACVDIRDCKSADEVCEKILPFEHKAMRSVVAKFSRGRFVVEGRKVRYEDGRK